MVKIWSIHGFWPILAVTLVFFAVWSPIMPLGESLTMLGARTGAIDYGRVRLWGSLSFIAAAVLAGRALADRSEDLVFWLLLATIAFTLAACVVLPDIRPPRAEQGRAAALTVLSNRSFVLFLVSAALIQASHAVYYAFGTIHWKSVGYSEDLIGALWAEGVIAEIVLFALGARLLGRLGPARLIASGGLAGVLRWLVTGWTDALPALCVVQVLHAFTFGAVHLGAIHYIAERVPPSLSATAQSLYSAVVMGLAIGLAVLVAGHLYATHGAAAYYAMAALAGLGGALALVLAGRDHMARSYPAGNDVADAEKGPSGDRHSRLRSISYARLSSPKFPLIRS